MIARPDRNLTVLCGHTHSDSVEQILPNLTVRTRFASYGQPDFTVLNLNALS